ncbi:scopoletin glucosyltransferase-like [Triticum aestivum]|nr:scopoletin glucosyltransferase-like [Triticum aestivum]
MAVKGEQQQQPLHILFFPFPAHGHLIPIADMAALFAARGVRCTILTTPVNAAIMRSAVDRANDAFAGTNSPAIDISVVPFPDVGLPPGVENGTAIKSQGDRGKFFEAAQLLREPFDRFLVDNRPDAVVSDSLFPWSVDAAAEHGVPRLAFMGSSMFALSCIDTMLRNNPLATVPDDPDALVSLPGLPHRVELRRSQLMDPANEAEHWGWAFFEGLNAADQRSFGEVFNSFHELEPDYVEHYRTTLGRRAWLVGPVALATKDMAGRGTDALSPDADNCIEWLDMKPAGSVVYISFGTLTSFSPAELHELARGLELSGMNFVWVIGAACPDSSEWMPEGFAELTAHGGRGFIIRGWAPQMLILNHPAVGGFLTHCGWNSTLEAVSAGVPMVTWPRYADQFNNEKVIVELLKVGVSIGAKDYASCVEAHEVIGGEVIAGSIGRLMGNGEEGDAMRKKAKALGGKARSAVEDGGSSYNAVGRLIDELMARRSSMKAGEM